MNKNLLKHYLAPAAIYVLPYFFLISPWYRYLFFVVGVFLGMLLLIFDEEQLYHYYQDEADASLQDLEQDSMNKESEERFVVTRSTLFLLSLVPLSLFVVTSTGSALGIGFVLGMILGLIIEMWMLRNSSDRFRRRFLRQLKIEMSPERISLLVLGSTAFFIILNAWSLILR
jgi:uncharacterized membrane-anchored protein YhcB (DUF1043 family)